LRSRGRSYYTSSFFSWKAATAPDGASERFFVKISVARLSFLQRSPASDFSHFNYLPYFYFSFTVLFFFEIKKVVFPFSAAFQNKQFG